MKIAIFGVGRVGSSIANALINNQLCDSLLLYDTDYKKASAECDDLLTYSFFESHVDCFVAETITELVDCDVVIICASQKYKKGMSRLDFANSSMKIAGELVNLFNKNSFKGVYIVVSNPVDLVTSHICEISNLSPSRIIGTGTVIDSYRLAQQLVTKKILTKDNIRKFLNCLCIGEHGDEYFVPISMQNTLLFGQTNVSYGKVNELIQQINERSNKIICIKNATTWGITSVVIELIKAIVYDTDEIFSITHSFMTLQKSYQCCLGYPAKIGKSGIKSTISLELTEEEEERIHDIYKKILLYSHCY